MLLLPTRRRYSHSLSPYGALVASLLILLLLGFLVSSMVSYFALRQSIRQGIIDTELPLTSDNMYSEIQRDMVRPIVISTMMGRDTFLRDWVLAGENDISKITNFLQEIGHQYNAVTTYFVSGRTGNYYQTKGILKQVNPASVHDRWYYEFSRKGDPYSVEIDTDEANGGELTIFINCRVVDYHGQFLGVAGIGLKAERITEVIDGYRHRYGRNVYFVDSTGTITLTGSDGGPFGARTGHSLERIPGLERFIKSLPSPQGGNFEYLESRERHFMNVRYIPELRWYLIIDKSDAGMLAGARHALYVNLFICTITSAIVLILVTVTLQWYQRQLRIAEQKRYDTLSSLTHDMRVPHTSIMALLDMERMAERSPHALQVYSRIERYAQRALHMADSFVLLTRAETKDYVLEDADLNALMFDAIDEVSPIAQRKTIELRIVHPIFEGCVARVDRDLFRRALINLLENSVKYSESGTHVECSVFCSEDGQQRVGCMIRDQGRGMSGEEQKLLFERFRRLPSAEHSAEPGAGLGLAFVKTVVDRHRGQISVVSEPGKGTSFTLWVSRL